MVIDADFWRGKRVFLTGHTGFKGAWLSLWLQTLGARVHGYSLAPLTDPNLYRVARVRDCLDSETISDIRDVAGLKSAMAEFAPDIVLHLAAQAIVLTSYDDPVETFSTNVIGTVTVLEAVRATPSVRAVVAVTSDKCYENREWVWGYRESDAMGGHDPYSGSKGAAELAISSMRRSFFPPAHYDDHRVAIASARAGNVIGGGDWSAFRLIPDLLRAISSGEPCPIRNPSAIRPWQHVLDPLSGYLTLAAALWHDGRRCSEGWNFGPPEDSARPVSWIADRLVALWPGAKPWITGQEPTPHENVFLKLDISKAAAGLDWRPSWSLETSLQAIVAWQLAWQQGADMQDFCRSQIMQFTRDAA